MIYVEECEAAEVVQRKAKELLDIDNIQTDELQRADRERSDRPSE